MPEVYPSIDTSLHAYMKRVNNHRDVLIDVNQQSLDKAAHDLKLHEPLQIELGYREDEIDAVTVNIATQANPDDLSSNGVATKEIADLKDAEAALNELVLNSLRYATRDKTGKPLAPSNARYTDVYTSQPIAPLLLSMYGMALAGGGATFLIIETLVKDSPNHHSIPSAMAIGGFILFESLRPTVKRHLNGEAPTEKRMGKYPAFIRLTDVNR